MTALKFELTMCEIYGNYNIISDQDIILIAQLESIPTFLTMVKQFQKTKLSVEVSRYLLCK